MRNEFAPRRRPGPQPSTRPARGLRWPALTFSSSLLFIVCNNCTDHLNGTTHTMARVMMLVHKRQGGPVKHTRTHDQRQPVVWPTACLLDVASLVRRGHCRARTKRMLFFVVVTLGCRNRSLALCARCRLASHHTSDGRRNCCSPSLPLTASQTR